MASFEDRVRETTSTTGTGSLTLAGALSGYRAFSSAFATGDMIAYCIVNASGTEWEVGQGTLTGSTTLTRETVFASSNANALVNLTGTHDVFSTLNADFICDLGQAAAYQMGFAMN